MEIVEIGDWRLELSEQLMPRVTALFLRCEALGGYRYMTTTDRLSDVSCSWLDSDSTALVIRLRSRGRGRGPREGDGSHGRAKRLR